jgi:hypothetical protein
MSGLEPILIGAAIGGGTSAAMGGDPLQGALMGGITGGAASGLGGVAAGASSGAASGAAGGAAQAFPVALESSITSSLLPEFASAALPSTASWAAPHLVASNVAPVIAETGTAGLLDSLSSFAPMLGKMGGSKQPQDDMSAPPIRKGQAVAMTDPLEELYQQQGSRRRSANRPISLL